MIWIRCPTTSDSVESRRRILLMKRRPSTLSSPPVPSQVCGSPGWPCAWCQTAKSDERTVCVLQAPVAALKMTRMLSQPQPVWLCCEKKTDLLKSGETSKRGFDMTEHHPFKWRHFQADIILLCVR